MIRYLLATAGAVTLWVACTEPPPEQLTYKQRKRADSIAKIEMQRAGDSLDSLCKVHFEEYVHKAYDSILNKRREEIQRLMR